jgi:hypothetical protein
MPHMFTILGEKVVLKRNPWKKIKPDIAKTDYIFAGVPPWVGDGSKVHGETKTINKVFKYIAENLKVGLLGRIETIRRAMKGIAEGKITTKEDLDSLITEANKVLAKPYKSKAQIAAARAEVTPRFKRMKDLIEGVAVK